MMARLYTESAPFFLQSKRAFTMPSFLTEGLTGRDLYPTLVGAVLPRPIAWVSTRSVEGVDNLAPYSFFTVASVSPPVLTIAHIAPRSNHAKDTLANLLATREAVVQVVPDALAQEMNLTAGEHPSSVSEFDVAGLERAPSLKVQVPGVAASPVRFECTLRGEPQWMGHQPTSGCLILLDIVAVHIDDRVLADGKIAPSLLDAIGKMGGDGYARTRERFEMARPQVAPPSA